MAINDYVRLFFTFKHADPPTHFGNRSRDINPHFRISIFVSMREEMNVNTPFIYIKVRRRQSFCNVLLFKLVSGEIVPRRNRTQEKSYPTWMGTISLEKSYPGYDFSGDIVPRVRFLQRYRTLFLQYFFDVYWTVEKNTYALFKFIKCFKTCMYFSSKIIVQNIRYI